MSYQKKTIPTRKHNVLREKVLEILEIQLTENNPPEAKTTFERLKAMDYEENDAKHLIVKCLIIEISDAMKCNKFFNEKRYVKNLKKLPNDPETED
jgi:hypothetical protein